MPPMERWSNEHKNIVLLGDAYHYMQNHMDQGAGKEMDEDGVFLGRVLSEVIRRAITISEAIGQYEKRSMQRAWTKQQVSLVSGELNMCSDPEDLKKRDNSSAPEVEGHRDGGTGGSPDPAA